MVNKYYEQVFCINLDRRTDRRAQAEEEFKKFGIKVEFVSGVDGKDFPHNFIPMLSLDGTMVSRGDIGCTMSHLKIVHLAKARKLHNYFVFEDDVEFAPDFNNLFEQYLPRVPKDCKMLYLGGNHDAPIRFVDENVYQMSRTFTTHAMGIHHSIYDDMISVLSDDKVDICISALHKKYPCYVLRPHLAFQRAGFSDILEKHQDYQHLRK